VRKQIRSEEPQVLKKNADKWNSRWRDLRAKNPSAKFSWYQHQGRSLRDWILPHLREMNQSHCSFCDSFPIEATSNEPIEHFRPKSHPEFAEQAYSWANLYYCCEKCQSSKREKWNEHLLRPDDFEYSFSRYFVYDFTTGQISPNPKATPLDQRRAAVTIELYGLDNASRRRLRRLALKHWGDSKQPDALEFPYRDYIEMYA